MNRCVNIGAAFALMGSLFRSEHLDGAADLGRLDATYDHQTEDD